MEGEGVPNPQFLRLELFTDIYASKILALAAIGPCGAQEMSRKLDIPIAVCYRRIKELEKAGLIRVAQRYLNRRGKRVNLYVTNVQEAKIEFVDGHWRVHLIMKSGSSYMWEDSDVFSLGDREDGYEDDRGDGGEPGGNDLNGRFGGN
ncbi:MAG: helix-turn-helix transcriptional regulator [Thermoplasmata archaeon]|nr:helix-turn-helix transcriptional regulator [Thermoplasmata archaeon]